MTCFYVVMPQGNFSGEERSGSGLADAAQMRRCGTGGVVGPGLRPTPGAGSGEVDAEGAGGAVGGEDFGEAVAQLGERCGESTQAGDRRHASEVKGVARGVEVTFEDRGVSATESECGGGELE